MQDNNTSQCALKALRSCREHSLPSGKGRHKTGLHLEALSFSKGSHRGGQPALKLVGHEQGV